MENKGYTESMQSNTLNFIPIVSQKKKPRNGEFSYSLGYTKKVQQDIAKLTRAEEVDANT